MAPSVQTEFEESSHAFTSDQTNILLFENSDQIVKFISNVSSRNSTTHIRVYTIHALQIEERGLKVMIGRCIHLHIRREHSEGPISVIDWVP